jgi:Zn-dependent oligopeptidase
MSKFQISQNMRKDLYQVYKTYYECNFLKESTGLSEERQKYVHDEMVDYKLNGLALDDVSYERVMQIKMDMSELCNNVSLNSWQMKWVIT